MKRNDNQTKPRVLGGRGEGAFGGLVKTRPFPDLSPADAASEFWLAFIPGGKETQNDRSC
jgi:hypothetical protein